MKLFEIIKSYINKRLKYDVYCITYMYNYRGDIRYSSVYIQIEGSYECIVQKDLDFVAQRDAIRVYKNTNLDKAELMFVVMSMVKLGRCTIEKFNYNFKNKKSDEIEKLDYNVNKLKLKKVE